MAGVGVEVAAVLVPELVDLLVALLHGELDARDELGHDGELLQPEGRVDVLAHVLSVPVPPPDHVVPLLQGVHEDVHVVPPVLYPLLDRRLLEKRHQDLRQLLLKRTDLDHLH